MGGGGGQEKLLVFLLGLYTAHIGRGGSENLYLLADILLMADLKSTNAPQTKDVSEYMPIKKTITREL